MSKATLMLTAGLLLLMSTMSYSQTYPRYGYFLYKGPTSIDVYIPKLTDAQYKKIEYFVNGAPFATAEFAGPEQGLKTYEGLTFGPGIATLQARFTLNDNSIRIGTVINAPSFATEGWGISTYEFYGVLAREERMRAPADLSDTLYIVGAGEVPAIPFSVVHDGLPGSNVPGGHFIFEDGAELGYDLSIGSNLSTITVFGPGGPGLAPGQISATGGKIKELIVYCHGQFGPASNFTIEAANFLIDSDYPTRLDNCTLDWDPGNFDFGLVQHQNFKVVARNCVIQNESQILGADTAYKCTIYKNSTLWASHVIDCDFDDGGNLSLRPPQTPTSCINSDFTLNSGVTLSNESVFQYNTMDYDGFVNLNVSGFDPSDVENVHVNFNHFKRGGGTNTSISNSQADTIDCTLNYWGRCEGPDKSHFTNQNIRWFPFLREEWPATSYWMEVTKNKEQITANDQDEMTFTFHFYNVVTNEDSADVGIDYIIRIFSDTLTSGTLTTDANGIATLTFTVPFEYRDALSVQCFFTAFQCNEQVFNIPVKQQEGADLSISFPQIVQLAQDQDDLIAGRGFAVTAFVVASEPISTPFRMTVVVDGEEFEEFALVDDQNIKPDYTFKEYLTETVAENNRPRTFIWFINKTDIDPGSVDIALIVDPVEAGKPNGRIQESNEINNRAEFTRNVIATAWGNDGSTNASFFVQPIDPAIPNTMEKTENWADSALAFIQASWPTVPGSFSSTMAAEVADYTSLHPDTMETEDWQPYLVSIYKEIKKANPNHDRYVFAVNQDWFTRRMRDHRLSQTLTWSGVYDMALASVQWYKNYVHTLGHTFHLKRQDLAPTDPDQQEEYLTTFLGKTIKEGYDVKAGRIYRFGVANEANQPMQAYSFMGASSLPNPGQKPYYWITGESVTKFTDLFLGANGGLSKSSPVPCVLISGRVDSVNMAFEFDTWSKLPSAVPSAMCEDQYAKYIFKAMDGSNTVLASHNYTPTFRALGLDETDPSKDPHMLHEYFAFAMPFPAGATKIVLEDVSGTPIFEREISANAPEITITPENGKTIPPGQTTGSWSATDPDGQTEFWYTVDFSRNEGQDWERLQTNSQATSADLGNLDDQDDAYILRVTASDGVNEATASSWFYVDPNDVEDIDVARDFVILQNYPNPFNPSTTLTYNIPATRHVRLEVRDALGRIVKTLVDDQMSMGTYTVQFNAAGLPSGTYTAVLMAGSQVRTVTMTLSK